MKSYLLLKPSISVNIDGLPAPTLCLLLIYGLAVPSTAHQFRKQEAQVAAVRSSLKAIQQMTTDQNKSLLNIEAKLDRLTSPRLLNSTNPLPLLKKV